MAIRWLGQLSLCLLIATLTGFVSGQNVQQCQERLSNDVTMARGRLTCPLLERYSRCYIQASHVDNIPGLRHRMEDILEKFSKELHLDCDLDRGGIDTPGDHGDQFEDFGNNNDLVKAYYGCQADFLSALFDLQVRSWSSWSSESCDLIRDFMLCTMDAFDFEADDMTSWQKRKLQQQLDMASEELGFQCDLSLDSLVSEYERRRDDEKKKGHITMYMGGVTAAVVAVLLVVCVSVRMSRRAAIQRRAARRHAHPVTANHLGHVVYDTAHLPPGVTYNDKLHPATPPSYAAEPPAYDDLRDDGAARNPASAPPPHYAVFPNSASATGSFPNSASAAPMIPDSAPPAYNGPQTTQYVLYGGSSVESGGVRT